MINFTTRCLPRDEQTQSHLANEEIRTREAIILHSTNFRALTMCQGSAWEFVWFFYFPTDGPRLLALQELNLLCHQLFHAHQLSKDSWGLLSPYPCNPLSLHSSFSCSNSVGPQGSNHHQGPVLFITGWSDFLQRWLFPSWPMASLSNLNPFHTSSEKHLGTPTK